MTTLNMTTTAATRPSNATHSPFEGLMAAISGLLTGWKGYQAFAALNELSDEALAARGVTRKDLPRLAFEAMDIKG
jgi:uncharacterized protein YjiS (DUF1127 family)